MDDLLLRERAVNIRESIIEMITAAKSGHPGGSLSSVEIMVSLFFGGVMSYDPKNPQLESRDRFFLSKGHAAPVLYSTLAEAGYFDKSGLNTLRQLNSPFQGHPDMRKLPGIEASTGSLGQGLSISVGCALGLRLKGLNSHVFTLLGDGELEEGQIWEAAMAASHFKLDNLTAIVDRNRLQIDGFTEEIMSLEPLTDKWRAFGWNVLELNGHSFDELIPALKKAKKRGDKKPQVIIAHTIKGKGVSFMENVCDFHGKAPSEEQAKIAYSEIKECDVQ
ncbi:transketolase subunit A [Thermodesulfobium acidiphilum]|uniref:Transketolase subunit A n=1 Tax=Thermodesulfobium acidiphilum TaxID=1794699 RepID=A0A2R4W071_THEAF|nr:transketolase [Thermodesulfobium acidiphilum]AWB10104.1 transketolase subunit A [Thermodesulfobium acidiphilum]